MLAKADGITPKKMKNYSAGRFNSHFEQNKINDNCPFSNNGYGEFMTASSKNREDVDVAKSQHVHIPKQQLVLHKEPECLPSSSGVFGNCYQLGHNEVSDFSGGGGTDIMQAYCESAELVDTQIRYNSIDDISSKRSGESLVMSAEDQAYHKKSEIQRQRLEQYRLNNMNNNSRRIANQYVQLHRRLI